MAKTFFESEAQVFNKRAMQEIHAHVKRVLRYCGDPRTTNELKHMMAFDRLNEGLEGVIEMIEDQ